MTDADTYRVYQTQQFTELWPREHEHQQMDLYCYTFVVTTN